MLFTQIISKEKRVYYLCRACAEEKSGAAGSRPPSVEAPADAEGEPQQVGAALVCPECGETFAEFQKRGLFGCAACYRMFAPELDRLLKRIHGACRHKADAPDGEKIGRESLFFLERQLKQAVARDAFEEAARLRDQIALRKAQVREP